MEALRHRDGLGEDDDQDLRSNADLLNDLTNKLGLDRGRVIAEALSLMYLGVTAQQDGMQMAIVDQGGTLQTALDLLPGN